MPQQDTVDRASTPVMDVATLERVLTKVVERGWTTERVARDLAIPRIDVVDALAEVGNLHDARHLREALADTRAGRDPREAVTPRFGTVATSQLRAHPSNVRDDLGDLSELAASMSAQGVLHRLLIADRGRGVFVVLDGHRRLAAARLVGISEVPYELGDERSLTAKMLASAMHKNLTPLEQGHAFARFTAKGIPVDQIAAATGYTPRTIRDRLSLLDLPADAQQLVREGTLSTKDATGLARQVRTTRTGTARPRGPKRPAHFTGSHPLAVDVRALCKHRDTRVTVGGTGCGQCWERLIAATAVADYRESHP